MPRIGAAWRALIPRLATTTPRQTNPGPTRPNTRRLPPPLHLRHGPDLEPPTTLSTPRLLQLSNDVLPLTQKPAAKPTTPTGHTPSRAAHLPLHKLRPTYLPVHPYSYAHAMSAHPQQRPLPNEHNVHVVTTAYDHVPTTHLRPLLRHTTTKCLPTTLHDQLYVTTTSSETTALPLLLLPLPNANSQLPLHLFNCSVPGATSTTKTNYPLAHPLLQPRHLSQQEHCHQFHCTRKDPYAEPSSGSHPPSDHHSVQQH